MASYRHPTKEGTRWGHGLVPTLRRTPWGSRALAVVSGGHRLGSSIQRRNRSMIISGDKGWGIDNVDLPTCTSISQWLCRISDPQVNHCYINLSDSQLLSTVTDQKIIGWSKVWRGYLAVAWTEAFQSERKCSFATAQRQWTTHVIQALWTTVDRFWTHCNTVHHAKDQRAKQIRESQLDSQIWQIYYQQEDFAVMDHEIFALPLEEQLRQNARAKRHCLILAQKYQTTTAQQIIGSQPRVTSFFAVTRRRNISHHICTENTRGTFSTNSRQKIPYP